MNPYPPPVPGYPGYPIGAAPPPGYPPYHQQPQQPYAPSHSPYAPPHPPTYSPGERAAEGHPAGLYAPGSHHKTTLSPSASSNNLGGNSPGPGTDAGQAERAAQVLAKTRSVMACVLCRKQKVSRAGRGPGGGSGERGGRPSEGAAGALRSKGSLQRTSAYGTFSGFR